MTKGTTMKFDLKDLNVCEIGTLYLLKANAKKGLIETTTLELPKILKVSRMSALNLLAGLEETGFLRTERTLGSKGKLKIFIANCLNFRQLEQANGLNFRQFEKQPESAVCIGGEGRNSNEILGQKINARVKNPSSFPLNKPPINSTNYNYNYNYNKIKTTNNITPAHTHSANDNNNLFKLEKPSFPNFDKAGKLADIVIDFFNYRKKDIKKPIKTQRGLDRLINRLKAFSGENIALAKQICDQSKDYEWQDIFELKGKPESAEPKENLRAQEQKRRAFLDSLIGDK